MGEYESMYEWERYGYDGEEEYTDNQENDWEAYKEAHEE